MKPKAYSYIRFSRPEQELGDSARRQLEASRNYARAKGFNLDETLADRGLSAYHGTHRDKGHLGVFLNLVESGQIPEGSMLVVENLDRLSRQEILTALNQFIGIIEAGIRLVTLQDGMEYTKESVTGNWSQLIISITIMARAHEESAAKSKRLKAAWVNKREKAVNKVNNHKRLTRKVPYWIDALKDRDEMFPIPEACATIERIYRMKLSGKGKVTIARELNNNPDVWKPISKRNPDGVWRYSYIEKILNNPEVIGQYQPHKFVRENGRRIRIPEGDPIKDYYPRAIDDGLYYQVQEYIKSNAKQNGQGGGRRGKYKNLFTHIVQCGLCGESMHFIDKGPKPKGGQYLRCRHALYGHKCDARNIRYDEFERIFFKEFEQLDITKLMPDDEETNSRINQIEQTLVTRKAKITLLENRIRKLREDHFNELNDDLRQMHREDLEKANDDLKDLQNNYKEIEQEYKELQNIKSEIRVNVDRTREVYQWLDSAEDDTKRIEIRRLLQKEIQRLVEWIKIYPLTEKYEPGPVEVEQDIYRVMTSKSIEKIRIKYKNIDQLTILPMVQYLDGTVKAYKLVRNQNQ